MMIELLNNDRYKVAKIELAAGTSMPRHFVNSEAFLIVESGEALLIYKGERCELITGSNLIIPPNEAHMLKVIKDFKAFIILGNNATLTYPETA